MILFILFSSFDYNLKYVKLFKKLYDKILFDFIIYFCEKLGKYFLQFIKNCSQFLLKITSPT